METVDNSKIVRSIDVKLGSLGTLIKAMSEIDGAPINAGQAQEILDYVCNPDNVILRITLDGSVASLALHEDLIEVLSSNGLLEVFT